MSRRAETPLTFHVLYESSLVRVRDYRCQACRSGPAAEEYSDSNDIVLLRHGAFGKHFGRRSEIADVNQAVFFSRGSTYRVSHPADCGDRGTVFVVAPHLLHEMIRELHPSLADDCERTFPFVTGPCEADVFWRHHKLVRRLEAAEPLDPLWVDETALQLVADVLQAAYLRHGLPRRRHRNGTEADHAERVEAVKTYLAGHLGERITLAAVARAAHTSPFHLARLFQRRSGVPIHRYLIRLRLRAALERLADGATDLTALALELGFASHSHFTEAFRREFGQTPSAMRRKTLREMSKNLKV